MGQFGPNNSAAQANLVTTGPELVAEVSLSLVQPQSCAIVETQPTSSNIVQQQNLLFSSISGFDREFFKKAMVKILENLIRGEGSTSAW